LELALDFEKPVVSLDDVFHNGEAKPGSSEFAGASFIDAIKPLSEAREICLRYPTAGISNCNFQPFFFSLPLTLNAGWRTNPELGALNYLCCYRHRPARRCVLDRIINQVDQYLMEAIVVSDNGWQFRRTRLDKCHATLLRFLLQYLEDIIN